VHHVGILYDQFMMHGQRNIKLLFSPSCFDAYRFVHLSIPSFYLMVLPFLYVPENVTGFIQYTSTRNEQRRK